MNVRARIAGVGMYVPERVVTNADLEKLMDTSDAWIQQRSGIRERRHVAPGQTPTDLAEPTPQSAGIASRFVPHPVGFAAWKPRRRLMIRAHGAPPWRRRMRRRSPS